MKRQETDLKAICARLESLSHSQPSEVHRREAEDALHSKWEGVQVWAGRCLAAWGGKRSVAALRAWLESTLTKEAGWAVRGEAIRALCQSYQAEDVDWLLDLYFETSDRLLRHEFLPVITALPDAKVRKRIAQEAKHADAARREAATIANRRLESWLERLVRRSSEALQPTSRAHRKPNLKRRSRAARS